MSTKTRNSDFYQRNLFESEDRFDWYDLNTKVPPSILAKKSFPFNTKIPVQRNWNESEDKLLIVVEHVDSADLKSKYLLSSREGVVLTNLIREAQAYYKRVTGATRQFALAAVNFNYCKTYHLDSADQAAVEGLAANRVNKLIRKLKPTHVLFVGDNCAAKTLGLPLHQAALERGWVHVHEGAICASTLDITDTYRENRSNDDDESEDDYGDSSDRTLVAKANLLGFVLRNVLTLWFDKLPYSIKKVKPNARLVLTIEQFDSMMEEIDAAKVVAVDTETKNLSVLHNSLLIIQFATTSKYGYVLPVHHPDAVWTKREKTHILNRLREFFAQEMPLWSDEDSRHLVIHNAPFDLRILRKALAIPVIYWPVWDTMAGEFLLDENFNATRNYGVEYGRLAGLCCLYGNSYYYTKDGFSKEDRSNIEGTSLEDPTFIDYCSFDSQCLVALHNQQIRFASTLTYEDDEYLPTYLKFNLVQMSSIVHDFSHMTEVGVPTDMEYLLYLLSPKSPINDAIKSLRDGFKDFDSIQKTNKLLTKSVQSNGLFGSVQRWDFNPGKAEHVQKWMFDVLKLEPVAYTAKGTPGTGKALQQEYKAIPEIAHFTRYKKTIHLKRSFLGPFYNHVADSEDGRTDSCIRPGYGYLDVVTGRSNSFRPSLQQVPQRTAEAKLLKRAFVAGTKQQNRIVLKLDYNTHEVRGWAITAVDKKLGNQFKRGRILRSQFMATEDESLVKQIRLSDLHRINVGLFFGVDIETMDPDELELLRDLVKAIVFGCFTADTIVSTPRGPVRVGALTRSGKKPKVITQGGKILPSGGGVSQGIKPIVGVRTRHSYLKGTPDHEVLTVTRDCKLTMVPMKNLKKGMLTVYQAGTLGNSAPTLAGRNLSIADVEAMGLFTADGSANYYEQGYCYRVYHGSIGKTETTRVRDFFYRYSGVKAPIKKLETSTGGLYTICQLNNKQLYCDLLEFGLLGNQHDRRVPDSILIASPDYVRAFLRGFFEGDGGIRNVETYPQIFATTCNPDMAVDIVYLLNCLGFHAKTYGDMKESRTIYLKGRALNSNGVTEIIIAHSDDVLRFIDEIGFITKAKKDRCAVAKKSIKSQSVHRDPPSDLAKFIDYKALRAKYATSAGVKTFRSRKVYVDGTLILPLPKGILAGLLQSIAAYKESFYALGMQDEWNTLYTLTRSGSRGSLVYQEARPLGKAEVFDVVNVVKDHTWSANGVIVSNSIYGRSVASIARATNRPVDEVQKVYDKFFARYKNGGDWLADMKVFAFSHLHAYSLLGRKRNLWGYLTGSEAIIAANGRQAINSPIQGMGADIAHLASRLYTIELMRVFKRFGWAEEYDTYKDAVSNPVELPVIQVMVHDSSRTAVDFDKALVVLQLLNWVYTTGTERALKDMFGVDLVCPLEVEFEIGPDDAHLQKWNWSFSGLEKVLRSSLETAKKENLIENLDVEEAMNTLFYSWKKSKARKYMDKHYPWFSEELSGKDAVWKPE